MYQWKWIVVPAQVGERVLMCSVHRDTRHEKQGLGKREDRNKLLNRLEQKWQIEPQWL